MKITIVQGAFLPVPAVLGGAVEKMWFALGKDFARLGHEVIQISRAFENLPEEEWIDGVQHKRVSGFTQSSAALRLKWKDLVYTYQTRKLIPSDTDVIVTNTFWAPIIFSKTFQRKILIDVARMPKGQLKLYKSASRYRANSTPVALAIQKEIAHKWHKKIITIPNPLPFVNDSAIEKLEKKNVVLYAGRVHPEKGIELLIEAFNKDNSSWLLKIVGPSEVSAGGGGIEYVNMLKGLAKHKRIQFIGPVFDTNQLDLLYHEASIFVYPSVAEKGETFGLAPLEAMSWGCVPIVSNLTCFKDFISDEQNGLIFDHNSKDAVSNLHALIKKLQDDKPLKTRLSAAAIDVRTTHSSSHIATLFLDEFERMVKEYKNSN